MPPKARRVRIEKAAPRVPVTRAKKPKAVTNAIGATGLKYSSGLVNEEFLRTLQGQQGMKVIREMVDNDPTIGAFYLAIKMLMRHVEWKVLPAAPTGLKGEASVAKAATDPDNPDAPADTTGKLKASPEALELAAFVDSCRQDMEVPWSYFLSECISFIPFGYSLFEVTYKPRRGPNNKPDMSSRYADGRIGWASLAPRAQESIDRWEFDKATGRVTGVWQKPNDEAERLIPMERMLHFVTESTKRNPEGRSALRNAYRPWFFKKRIEETEGIGLERNLSGLPVLTAPEGMDLWNEDDPRMVNIRAASESIIRNLRRDEQEGLLLPFGWSFELASAKNATPFDTNQIINRYDQRIAMTVLADFLLLGHSKVGSLALAKSKNGIFMMSIVGYLNAIRDVFNHYAIPQLMLVNGLDPALSPRLDYNPLEVQSLRELAVFLKVLKDSGYDLSGDPNIRRHLFGVAGIPADLSDDAGGGGTGAQNDGSDGPEDAGGDTGGGKPKAGARKKKPKSKVGAANVDAGTDGRV